MWKELLIYVEIEFPHMTATKTEQHRAVKEF